MQLTMQDLRDLIAPTAVPAVPETTVPSTRYADQYCIVRGDRSGVQAGTVSYHNGQHVELRNARRLWYWSGASSLSDMAVHGVARPEKCKFACLVDITAILDAIEIIPCTPTARKSIRSVAVWTQH